MKTFERYNSYKDFTTLVAWQKARELKLFLYSEVIPLLPMEEKYNLNVQIRKVGVSGTANIAEGYGRYHYREAVRFYRMSRGSVYESKDHLTSCFDLHYIPGPVFEKGLTLIEETKVAINGYIRYVMKKKDMDRDEDGEGK
jgi:four helix bundle protein